MVVFGTIGARWLVLAIGLACSASCSEVPPSTSGSSAAQSSGSGGEGGSPAPIAASCKDGWCRIPAGSFVMGSPPDEYGHSANSEGQTEVTLAAR
jgi:hypothetical protein